MVEEDSEPVSVGVMVEEEGEATEPGVEEVKTLRFAT